MLQAASNFSHQISQNKKPEHQLVKHGVYSITRHPSYFGFFYWSIGTQILLGNPVSACLFAVVLWRFFDKRIQKEEIYLIRFFGKEYIDFRKHVPVMIPFIH